MSLPFFHDDEIAVLPFSAKVGSLDYEIWTKAPLEVALQSLNIEATKLSLSIYIEDLMFFPTDIMISFWRRVAALGHFEELGVGCYETIERLSSRH